MHGSILFAMQPPVGILLVGWLELLVVSAEPPPDIAQMRALRAEAQRIQVRADTAFYAGRLGEAATAYAQTVSHFEKIGRVQDAAYPRHQRGIAYWKLGNLTGALEQFQINLAYYHASGDRQSEAEYHYYIAKIFVRHNQSANAVQSYETARALIEDDYARMADIDHGLLRLYERTSDLDAARQVLERSKQTIPALYWTVSLTDSWQRLAMHAWPGRIDRFLRANGQWLGSAGLVAIAAGLCLVLRPSRRYTGGLVLALAAALLALATVELAVRGALPAPVVARHFLHPPNRITRFEPIAGILPGVSAASHFTTNEVGFRADPMPLPGTRKILAIGGSTTESLFLDDADAWPRLLQDHLETELRRKVWVGNAGKSGLTSFAHVVQLRVAARELKPDWVIVMAGINDLSVCISGGQITSHEGGGYIQGAAFDDEVIRSVYYRIAPPFSSRSIRLIDLVLGATPVAMNRAETVHRDHIIQDKAGLFYIEQRARRSEATIIDDLPEINSCLDAFETNLQQIVQFAKRQGMRIVLLTQGSLYCPDLTQEERALLWFGAVDRDVFSEPPPTSYYSVRVMAELLDAFNVRTRTVADAQQIPYLDVDNVLPKTTESYYDDVHLNPEGSKRLAASLSRLLLSLER